jgi:hypothetical protein
MAEHCNIVIIYFSRWHLAHFLEENIRSLNRFVLNSVTARIGKVTVSDSEWCCVCYAKEKESYSASASIYVSYFGIM